MNWAMDWASSLDDVWRSPIFPMWLTLAAAGFFGIIVLITLLRAEKSVANGALTVITLLSIAVAVAATFRAFPPGGRSDSVDALSTPPAVASLPALACIDDLAGDAVLNACEKNLFGSADSAAAAVAYAASQIIRLTSLGDVATASRNTTPEVQALRRAVERDRYGLMAYVLAARDHCTPASCPAFRSLGNTQQLVTNMEEHVYEGLITRYAPSWNAPPSASATAGAGLIAALPPSMPTGKPTNAEFPSASSIPPVNIMTPEPATPRSQPAAAAATSAAPAPRPSPAPAAKKPPSPKRAAAPVQIAPAAPAASAPPASDE